MMTDATATIKILAISGSLRSASSNTTLLRAAQALAPEQVIIELYDGLADLPHFNPDLEVGEQAAVMDWKAQVEAADGLIISSPEYAHGVPGSLKNALDWLVSGPEFYEKPVAFFHTSERGTYAQAALREIVKTMAGKIVEEASITASLLGKRLDVEAITQDPELSTRIRSALLAFADVLTQRRTAGS